MNKSYTRILSAVAVGVLIGLVHIPEGTAKLTQATLLFTPGEGSKPLVQGQTGEVAVGDRFTTGANEVREVLLTDGTVLTLGPNSDVVIEDYEYDREGRAGRLGLHIESGFVRVVGGVLNNTRSIKISTPTAELTLDNAAATVAVTAGRTRASLLYGKSLSMASGGKTETLVKPGFELVSVEKSSTPDGPSMQNGEVILADMAALETVQLAGKGDGQESGTYADRKSALETDVNAVTTEDQPAGQLANNTSTNRDNTPPPTTQTATLGLGGALAIADPAALSGDGLLAGDAPVTNTNGDFFHGGFVELSDSRFRRFQSDGDELVQSADVYTNAGNLGGSRVPDLSVYVLTSTVAATSSSDFGLDGPLVNAAGESVIYGNDFGDEGGLFLSRVDAKVINTLFNSPSDAIFIGDPDDVGSLGADYTAGGNGGFDENSKIQIPALVRFSDDNGSVVTRLFDLGSESKEVIEQHMVTIDATELVVGDIRVTRRYTGKQKPQPISGEMGGNETVFEEFFEDPRLNSIVNQNLTRVSGLGFFPGYNLETVISARFVVGAGSILLRSSPKMFAPSDFSKGAFYAFDFKPDPSESNAGERYFVYGGVAPADIPSGRLPGTGDIGSGFQAFRYDVRDGLTPDEPTTGFIPGSALRRDVTLGDDIVDAYDSGLVLIATNQSGAENAFLKLDFALNGEGANQKSTISASTGTAGNASTGLSGGMVGSTQLDARATATHLQSGVYSQPDENVATPTHWFGGNKYSDGTSNLDGKIGYIVLGSDNPDTDKIEFASEQVLGGSDAVEYEYLRLASRNVNNSGGSAPLAVVPTSRSTQTLSGGYAAALVQSVDGNTVALYALKSTADGSSVNLATKADTNRVTSRFLLVGESIDASPTAPTSELDISFGGDNSAELSAYIGDELFAARSSSATFDGSNAVGGKAALVSGAALREGLPESMRSEISDYQYVKWGFFFGDFAVTENRRDHVNLGSWVAAEKIPDVSELRLQGTATHVGHVVGNVFSGNSTYTAVGSYQNAWNFDKRAGAVTMGFDDRQYKGTTRLNAGAVTFNGSIATTDRAGTLDGALVGVRADGHPQGEIGQFSIHENPGSDLYRATGTFAAENR